MDKMTKPLLATFTKQEREMLKKIKEENGFSSEMAVLRFLLYKEFKKSYLTPIER